jgi:hypothetical protein
MIARALEFITIETADSMHIKAATNQRFCAKRDLSLISSMAMNIRLKIKKLIPAFCSKNKIL